MPIAPELRVLILQRAAVPLFGLAGSGAFLHAHLPAHGTTPAAAA
ncbi:hypothetical protein [Gemmatimonas sp.]